MGNRLLKDSINESKGLADCSLFSDDLFKRLITYADDYGRFNADTTIMRARLYPREYEVVSEADIIDGLIELAGVGKIGFYTARAYGHRGVGVYGAFPNWKDHQRIRETKAKCPEPDDTDVNDWYLRRFVSMDMKVEIVERDNFKCQLCGKFLTSCRDAKRFVKLGQGLYHIDHIVPVLQGGRATLENLRLTCPECNLKRKKNFTFQEILDFTVSPRVAADRRELPQIAARIQSESELESESKPKEKGGQAAKRFTPPTVEEVEAYIRERKSNVNARRFVDFYASKRWMVGKNPMKDWRAAIRTWEQRDGAQSQEVASSAPDAGELERMRKLRDKLKGGAT